MTNENSAAIIKTEVKLVKWMDKLASAPLAKGAAQCMRCICYLIMAFFILCLALSCMGRQSFTLHTGGDVYDGAIYAETDHEAQSRMFTVGTKDDVHVWTNSEGVVDPRTQAGLCLIHALQIVPLILAYWMLSRVFSNVHSGQIFVQDNARYLLYYGLLQCLVCLVVPWLKMLLCTLINQLSTSRMTLSTGHGLLEALIPGIACVVAAYIIHYGIYLQDEVDHTL